MSSLVNTKIYLKDVYVHVILKAFAIYYEDDFMGPYAYNLFKNIYQIGKYYMY